MGEWTTVVQPPAAPVRPALPPVQAQPAPAAAAAAPVSVPEQTRRRVELGFRDGTSAALDPDSEQALALAELTALLTGRG